MSTKEPKVLPSDIVERYLPPRELWPKLLWTPEYYEKLPEAINLSCEILDRNIDLGRKHKVALYFEDQKFTYRELVESSTKLASSLVNELGVKPFDRIGLRMRNIPEAVIIIHGILKAGAIPVPLHPRWSPEEVVHVCNDSGAVYLFSQAAPDQLSVVEEAKPRFETIKNIILVGDEKLAKEKGYLSYEELLRKGSKKFEPVLFRKDQMSLLLYTSGTTGPPKGVVHFIPGILAVTDAVGKYVWKFTDNDVLCSPAPICFALGFGALAMIPYRFGISASMIGRPPTTDVIFSTIEKHGVTVFSGPPTLYRKILPEVEEALKKYDISTVRLWTGGGEAFGVETIEAWREKTGMTIAEGFGATELYYIAISNAIPVKGPKPGSIGQPVPGVEVKILDEATGELRDRGEGSLLIRAPTGTVYWNPHGMGGRLLKKMKDDVWNGWVRLGDAVRIDEDGYVWFIGKGEDIIKSSGYRIGADEIETAILAHPAVEDAGVVGARHPIRWEDVVAFVQLKPGYKPSDELKKDIMAHLEKRIAKYKLPREIFFVDSLPRHTTGKLLRRELRKMAEAMYKPKD